MLETDGKGLCLESTCDQTIRTATVPAGSRLFATQVNRNDQPIKERGGVVDRFFVIGAMDSPSTNDSCRVRATMGYLGYWALFGKPFARSEGDYFFSAAPQREAIAGLSYFAASQFGAAFLVAPRRCGVSWLMRHVCQMHGLGDCATEVVTTDGLQHDCGDVATSLGQALGIRQESGQGVSLESIQVAIEASGRDGVRIVWLIDQIKACTINAARNLLASHPNLSVVLAATPEEHQRFVNLFRNAVVQVDLDPLSLDETDHYLREGLADVGCQRCLFHDGAIVRLHELTGGAIGDLSLAAEVSLAVAARYRMDAVTTAIVEAAIETHSQAA